MAEKGLTQTEAAERLRISTSWLRVLSDRGEVRRNEDGSYPWPGVAEDYEAYKERKEEGPEDEVDISYHRARARKTAADARLREDELAAKRGDLIPVDEVLAKVQEPLEAVDAKLRSAPRRLARTWAPRLGKSQAEAIALIGELVEDVRADLLEVFGDDGDSG